jgi:hypothetical protein
MYFLNDLPKLCYKENQIFFMFMILISLSLHFPWFYIHFRQLLKKCKIEVLLQLSEGNTTQFLF